ncbi:hypothetical protein [Desulfoplanes formicivorans]|uniref:Uncharacterized protein n=1 Tax=Desulfoplanes formicivorans TaxID=1592317 RepID=A0A194AKA4_9BACT|nr:hypothetical protein [Desulfoplanes formicivorans]GAU09144.1 hypothetical protein DPF_1864 [Desulfoplanes formicivorans]
MRDVNVNDVIKEFNRYYLDATLEEELAILGIGPHRTFKREQFSELYKPLFLTLWVHALDKLHQDVSDTVRDAYLKGLKECFRKQKGEYERMVGLVMEYEAMLADFSPTAFEFTATQIVNKISRNKDAREQQAQQLAVRMMERLAAFEAMLSDLSISPAS